MSLPRRLLPAALALLTLSGPALAQDPSFRLNNRSSVVVMEVYASSVNDASWGVDHLGANVLQPGQTLIVRLPQGQCMNDIRVVMANGQAHERRRIDTCQIIDYDIQ